MRYLLLYTFYLSLYVCCSIQDDTDLSVHEHTSSFARRNIYDDDDADDDDGEAPCPACGATVESVACSFDVFVSCHNNSKKELKCMML
jgi:hypothetical protein